MKIPMYATDLIKELDQAFPNRAPNMADSEREIWFKAGARSVVDLLLSLEKDQNEQAEMPTLLNTNEEE
jgi:hypothetical protein